MNVARGLVLVKPVATDEALGGGRILIPLKSRETMTSHQMIVVDVGGGAFCDDEDCGRLHGIWAVMDAEPSNRRGSLYHPVDPRIKPDAWVLVRHRSLVSAGAPGEKLYFVRQDDVLAVFEIAP